MAELYATRLKIGVVTPSTNTTLEPDCHALCPQGVTVHTARISIQNKKIAGATAYDDHVKAMRGGIDAAISQVVTCGPAHLIMGVALEAFWGGVKGSEILRQELESAAGSSVSIGSHAMHRALQSLKVKRIGVLTPHMPAGDEQVKNWFEEAGYEVDAVVGFCCESPRLIAEVSRQQMQVAVDELNRSNVEAIVQVGTNMQFRHEAIVQENRIGKPVLALNSVMMWDALRTNKVVNGKYPI